MLRADRPKKGVMRWKLHKRGEPSPRLMLGWDKVPVHETNELRILGRTGERQKASKLRIYVSKRAIGGGRHDPWPESIEWWSAGEVARWGGPEEVVEKLTALMGPPYTPADAYELLAFGRGVQTGATGFRSGDQWASTRWKIRYFPRAVGNPGLMGSLLPWERTEDFSYYYVFAPNGRYRLYPPRSLGLGTGWWRLNYAAREGWPLDVSMEFGELESALAEADAHAQEHQPAAWILAQTMRRR